MFSQVLWLDEQFGRLIFHWRRDRAVLIGHTHYWSNFTMLTVTYMNLVEYGGKLGIFGVLEVDGVHGGVEVLDVLRVHLEEGRVTHHHVPDLLQLGALVPAAHAFFQLQFKYKLSECATNKNCP
jgi:hypothetical protein